MKRLLSLVLLCVLILSGCAPAETSSSAGSSGGSERISFTDDLGRPLSLDRPERVACLIGSFADL